MSNPKSDPSNLSLPTLWIDYRSGSVAMQLGNGETFQGTLPMSAADRSQINTAMGVVTLERTDSVLSPGNGA